MHHWDNWLIMAFAAPALWALVNMLDVYFVESVYPDEYAAVFLTGLFQLLPWFAVPWIGVPSSGSGVVLLGITAGAFFSFSFLFYFKSLFLSGDVAFIQVIWNGTSIITPLLAFFLSGERLSGMHYLGIVIVFSGATLLSLRGSLRGGSKGKVMRHMAMAVLLMSCALVAETEVYRVVSFAEGLLLTTLGGFLAGLLCFGWRIARRMDARILKARGMYWLVFLGAELTALAGMIAYQRAINLAPSVSFIAVTESFLPVFVMGYSMIVCLVAVPAGWARAREIYATQLSSPALKIVAITIMAIGISLVE